MTAKDLEDKIQKLIEAEINKLDRETRKAYIELRKQLKANAQELWNVAAVNPEKSAEIGNIVYVSRAEANKYGRLDKLTQENINIAKKGLLTDISMIERGGYNIYDLSYNGSAWVYNQGYGLPITGGVKVRLIAETLYSDFYGATFKQTLKKNWAKFIEDINNQITRDLNQGKAYSVTAKNLSDLTNKQYKSTLRVANTEGHRIQSMAHQDSLKLLDQVGAEYEKIWRSILVGDERREDHLQMDGETADKDGVFHLPSGASGPGPGLTGNASDDINCKCYDIVVINGEAPSERRINGQVVPYDDYKTSGPSLTEVRKAV